MCCVSSTIAICSSKISDTSKLFDVSHANMYVMYVHMYVDVHVSNDVKMYMYPFYKLLFSIVDLT